MPEKFLDLPLFVDGVKGVKASLDLYFKPEAIEGFYCDKCDKPCTVAKGPQLKRLPPVLTFNLTKIKYDMETWDRIKINDRFEYPLEIDMSKYLEQTEEAQAQKSDPDLVNYVLNVIVIHRGGPYGGHYHAYIRDNCKEGNWNLKLPAKFASEPLIKNKNGEEEKKEEKSTVKISKHDKS